MFVLSYLYYYTDEGGSRKPHLFEHKFKLPTDVEGISTNLYEMDVPVPVPSYVPTPSHVPTPTHVPVPTPTPVPTPVPHPEIDCEVCRIAELREWTRNMMNDEYREWIEECLIEDGTLFLPDNCSVERVDSAFSFDVFELGGCVVEKGTFSNLVKGY